MILDTCVLTDLQRELRKGERGNAVQFLETNTSETMSISVISVTEFLEGFEDTAQGERLLRAYTHHDIDSSIATQAAVIRRQLRLSGTLIGDFDILIAATALAKDLPLVTRNTESFERVEGLKLIGYASAARG